MKLSANTIAIIDNFSRINPNLMIKPGNVLTTVSPTKFIFASATVEEDFPEQFGVYNLKELLQVLRLFDDPELDFDSAHHVLNISQGKMKVQFHSAEPEVLIYPKKDNTFPAIPDASFLMSSQMLDQITKAASVLRAEFISVVGDGKDIKLIVANKNIENSNRFDIDVGETDRVFTVNMKSELFLMMKDDYEVQIASSRRTRMLGTNKSYMLAWEHDSVFEV